VGEQKSPVTGGHITAIPMVMTAEGEGAKRSKINGMKKARFRGLCEEAGGYFVDWGGEKKSTTLKVP